MPETPGFLHRWSRRKLAGPGCNPEAGGVESEPRVTDPGTAGPAVEADPAEPDADLPDVETLGPESDYTRFMRQDVPAAIRRAALRKAWAGSPAIRRHKPLVDYDWDFNAPGYGRLRPGDDPQKLLATLFGLPPEAAKIDRAEEDAAEETEVFVPDAVEPDACTSVGGDDPETAKAQLLAAGHDRPPPDPGAAPDAEDTS